MAYAEVTSDAWTEITTGINAYFEVKKTGDVVELWFGDAPPTGDPVDVWSITSQSGFNYTNGRNCYARAKAILAGKTNTAIVVWEE